MQGIAEMFASLDGRDSYAWAVACHLEVQRAARRDYLKAKRRSDELQRAKWRAENRARASRPEALVQRALRAAQLSLQAVERQSRRAKKNAAAMSIPKAVFRLTGDKGLVGNHEQNEQQRRAV